MEAEIKDDRQVRNQFITLTGDWAIKEWGEAEVKRRLGVLRKQALMLTPCANHPKCIDSAKWLE